MWYGIDPGLQRELGHLRQMIRLQHQTPTREWPLMFVAGHDELLVVREWPDGSITAYLTAEYSDSLRNTRD